MASCEWLSNISRNNVARERATPTIIGIGWLRPADRDWFSLNE
jgi:hypothetical protein